MGDIDQSGNIGIGDLNVILSAWNTSVDSSSPADLDGSGTIGIGDLNIVLSNWNQ